MLKSLSRIACPIEMGIPRLILCFQGRRFRIRCWNSQTRIQDHGFNMAYHNFKNSYNLGANLCTGVFGVTDNESMVRSPKFKLANPIRLTKMYEILCKICIWAVLGLLITNMVSKYPNSRWQVECI